MADKIDAETRALIDQSIKDRGITRPEPPQRGMPKGFVSAPVQKRRKIVADLHRQGMTAPQISQESGYPAATVYADIKKMGLKLNRIERATGDLAAIKKQVKAKKSSDLVKDRRRFKTTPVPMGQPSIVADKDLHEPMFPSRVFVADGEEPVLKDGSSNSKIGGDVIIGRLKGAAIFTLTLPERTTCPKDCALYRGCYGNSMHYARRWAPGPELEAQLKYEIALACSANDQVLIRLHVLGDFYSFEYLKLWAEALDTHPNLNVFGFTARGIKDEIGAGIKKLRGVYPNRFMVRHSGRSGRWGSVTLDFPTEKRMIGEIVVCPEQRDAMEGGARGVHCGNCAVCWETNRAIAFVEH